MLINGIQQRRDRTGRKKRKLNGRKLRHMNLLIATEVYDQLAAISGPEPMVGMLEKLVEREFEKRVRRMGFMPPNQEISLISQQ